jgi:hypothetical protein
MAVKVEDSDGQRPKKRSGRTTQAEGVKRVTKYTNSDLPQGALENNDWRKKFITTYEKWLGACAGPWINDEDKNIAVMQTIWNAVYPHIEHTIDVDGPVYYIVSCSIPLFHPLITLAVNRPNNVPLNGGAPLGRPLLHCSRLALRARSFQLMIRCLLQFIYFKTVLSYMRTPVVKHKRCGRHSNLRFNKLTLFRSTVVYFARPGFCNFLQAITTASLAQFGSQLLSPPFRMINWLP